MTVALPLAFLALLPPAFQDPPPSPTIDLPTARLVLDNGMTVIVAPDPTTPLVAVRLLYRVGSRNEQAGRTGFAHLFEHMMFNGARRFGPKMFDAVLESAGGSGNAFTTTDFTCYTTQVPPQSLETVFELEADRMTTLVIARHILAREIQIVLEERRQVLEDVPTALAQTMMTTALFQAHPYRWPVLGWASDIRAASVAECRTFHRTYYTPNQAILVLAGDVEPERGFALAKKHFGGIERGPPVPAVVTTEPERDFHSRSEIVRKTPNPSLFFGFVGPSAMDPDHPVVDLLRQVLTNGASARLQRRLVQKDQLATAVAMGHGWLIDPEPLSFVVTLPPGGNLEQVEKALFEEIGRLIEEGVTEEELQRARTGATAGLVRELSTLGQRATTLGQFEITAGDHRHVFGLPARYEEITGEDLQRVAARFLRSDRMALVAVVPEVGR